MKKIRTQKRIAIYARTACVEQTNKRALKGQIETLQTTVEAQGYSVAAVYKDSGQSGNSIIRSGFQKMRRDARKNMWDEVWATEPSCLSRNAILLAAVENSLHKAKKKVVYLYAQSCQQTKLLKIISSNRSLWKS